MIFSPLSPPPLFFFLGYSSKWGGLGRSMDDSYGFMKCLFPIMGLSSPEGYGFAAAEC